MKPWHEDEDFWEQWEAFIFGKAQWESAAIDIENIIALLEIQPGSRVLDLCCGPGRHSLELARRGVQVFGVDRTKSYLDKAKKRAASDKLEINFILDDMRTFCRPNSFDVILNLYTSFSYFEDPDEDKQVLKNVYASLRSGGKFVIEMMGKEVLARIFLEKDWEERDGTFALHERKVAKDWSWMQNRWILIKNQEIQEFKVDHRLYSGTELANLLKDVGFKTVTIYGDFSGSPYDNKAKRLIGVAKKH